MFEEAGKTNTTIANEHAQQIDELNNAVSHLKNAGAEQRRIADMRQEILEEERTRHLYEKLTYWVLLIAFGAAAVQ